MSGVQYFSCWLVGGIAAAMLAGTALGQDKPTATNPGEGKDPKWSTSVVKPPENDVQVITTTQGEVVKKVTAYFNELRTLEGRFTQVDAEKKQSRGKFYLFRPGRFRFEYGGGSKKVIVSDGTYLAIQDLDSGNDDTYELDRTPFRLLLRKDVDLLRDASVMDVTETGDKISLKIKDKDPDAPGMIQLFMNKQTKLELAGWKIIDAQGLETTVDLLEVSRPEKLDPNLFKREMLFNRRL